MSAQSLSAESLAEARRISDGLPFTDAVVLAVLRDGVKFEHRGAMVRLAKDAEPIWDEAVRLSFERWLAERSDELSAPDAEGGSEVVVHKGVELGGKVMLDEDVYDGAHVPPRVYAFEEYDSEAPADSNCTLVEAISGDWTVRGIGELVPVDEVG
jgi:hypothetical protein